VINSANPTGEPTYIWINPNTISQAPYFGVINQDCNGLPIISSVNGPVGQDSVYWSKAATGLYCLTLPVASILTGNGPCIGYPNEPAPSTNWFKALMVKIIAYLVFWNKWSKITT